MLRIALFVSLVLGCKGGEPASTVGVASGSGSGSGSAAGSAAGSAVVEASEVWAGTLVFPTQLVDIVVTFTREHGALKATLAVAANPSKTYPLDSLALEPTKVAFTLTKPNGNEVYDFTRAGNVATGKVTLGGRSFDAKLVRVPSGGKPGSAIVRAQTPTGTPPYTNLDVAIAAPAQGELAGTLSLPLGKGPFPAVVLVSGSGQQDRDSTIYGHKPFAVIADKLVRAGIAVLRFDDRGTGKTTGAIGSLETDISDARAAFEWLLEQPEIDRTRTGLLGHSIGSNIVATVAARTQKAAFVVSLAGPGVSGVELVPMQLQISLEKSGMTPENAKSIADAQRAVGRAVVAGKPDAIRAALKASFVIGAKATNVPVPGDEVLGPLAEQKLKEVDNPWVKQYFAIDPLDSWRKVRVPVLALAGEKDFQVPSTDNLGKLGNLDKLGAALEAAGNRDVTLTRRPGLNHLFQRATTGLDDEYGKLDETFDPETLDQLVSWLVSRTAPK